ncbi:MAG: hypothetical protein E6J34_14865 [Chloroflexi bacterium]|nr:MAG: hypothetical protein E6J34_14865 [Chloroflexota bacterium]
MKTRRLLLPFTDGVEMPALDVAVDFAHHLHATLVLLVLFHVPEKQREGGARAEALQQAQDFFEAVFYKAARRGVPIERSVLTTQDVVKSILLSVTDRAYDSILLCVRDGQGLLLQTSEIKQLLTQSGPPLYVMHLPSTQQTHSRNNIFQHLSCWLDELLFARHTTAATHKPRALSAKTESNGNDVQDIYPTYADMH